MLPKFFVLLTILCVGCEASQFETRLAGLKGETLKSYEQPSYDNLLANYQQFRELMLAASDDEIAPLSKKYNLSLERIFEDVIIGFTPDVSNGEETKLLSDVLNIDRRRSLKSAPSFLFSKTLFKDKREFLAVAEFVNVNPRVRYVEINGILKGAKVPNDPRFLDLWGMHNTGREVNGDTGITDKDSDVMEAWDVQTGSHSIKVGILDSGVDHEHEDLAANYGFNLGEDGLDANGKSKRTNGKDDDGNGYVDDYLGWNANLDNGDARDLDHYHGTHVAGTVGAVGDNGKGVAGVAWKVKLVDAKVLTNNSGSYFDVAMGVEYLRVRDVHIINASLGGPGGANILREEIKKAGDDGILFVAAAGNKSSDNDSVSIYPASYNLDNMINVAATNMEGRLTDFSNYGKNTVHMAAPGESILSAFNQYQDPARDKYVFLKGTSMAAPMVAGAAALIWAEDEDLGYEEVKDLILENLDPLHPSDAGKVKGGHLNVNRAVRAVEPPEPDPVPPVTPNGLAAVATSTSSIRLTWQNVADETGYRIERRVSGGPWQHIVSAGTDATSYTNTGLNDDTTYYYRMLAYNGAGNSPYTSQVSAKTPKALPNKPNTPTGLSVVAKSSSSIEVKWNDVALESNYLLQRSTNNSSWSQIATPAANSTSYLNTGLSANTRYYYRIAATNAGGTSNYSASVNTKTIMNPPAAPTGLAFTQVLTNSVTFKWNNVSAETGFQIDRRQGAGAWSKLANVGVNVLSYKDNTVAANTAYSYRVFAFNSGGNSGYSNVLTGTTDKVPPVAPTGLKYAGVKQTEATLSWNNVAEEDEFRLYRRKGSGAWGLVVAVGKNVLSHVDKGLDPNASYSFRVLALNNGGVSPYSNVVTLQTLPNPPTTPGGLSAVTQSSSVIKITWDNVAAETGFVLQRSLDGSSFSNLVSKGPNIITHTDSGLAANKAYYYRVRAVNTGGSSTYSGVVSATTNMNAPATPGNFVATATAVDRIRLTWSDVANESTYIIERNVGGGSWQSLKTLAAGVVEYSDANLAANTLYQYRIKSRNNGGDSPWAQAQATTNQLPIGDRPKAWGVVKESSSDAHGARLSSNRNGDSLMVWTEGPSLKASHKTYGGNWSEGKELFSGKDIYYSMSWIDQGHAFVAINQNDDGKCQTKVLKYALGDGNVSESKSFDKSKGRCFQPAVATNDAGQALVAWNVEHDNKLTLKHSKFASENWGKVSEIEKGFLHGLQAHMNDAGEVQVVFVKEEKKDSELLLWNGVSIRSLARSDARSITQLKSSLGEDNLLHLIWSAKGGVSSISQTKDGWSDVSVLTKNGFQGAVASKGDKVIASFIELDGLSHKLKLLERGESWQPIASSPVGFGSAFFPRLVANARGEIVVLWAERTHDESKLVAAHFNHSNSTWRTPYDVTDKPVSGQFNINLDEHGIVTLFWSEQKGDKPSLKVMRWE